MRRAALWWGAPVSAAAHAAVIVLALWALPWLKARPDPGFAVMAVRLVGPEVLTPPMAPREAAPPSNPPPVAARREATVPHDNVPPEQPPVGSFAGRFDPDAALGLAARPTEPVAAPAPPVTDAEPPPPVLSRDFEAELRAAIERAKVYPRIARIRGLFGTTHVAVTISPDGRLINARVVRSSGSKALDDAALVSVRNATLPAPPPDAAATYDLGISFTLTDK